MKTKFSLRKKVLVCALAFTAMLLCLALALTHGVFGIALAETEAPIQSFNIAGGSIRLADNKQYNGVKFAVEMSESDFAEYITGEKIEYTGAVLCDASKLQSDENLTRDKSGAVDLDTTDLWNNYKTTVFMYGIPQTETALTNRLAVAGYYKLKDSDTVYYSNTVIRSTAEIACAAYTDRSATETGKYTELTSDEDYSPYTVEELALIKAYLPEYTVTYVANGTTFDTKTVLYGFKAEEVTAPEIVGKEFSAYKVNGEEYDFNTAVKSNITVTAEYVDKQYVYGTGVSIGLQTYDPSKVGIADFYDESSNKYMRGLTRTDSVGGKLTVSANVDANLVPNKEYKVIISVDLDGTANPSFYQVTNEWWLPRDVKIETTVTTKDDGTFDKTWEYYFASGTYVKFTSVTIEKMPEYVYGTGISLDINAGSGIAVVNELKDSTSDLYIKKITKEATAGGFAPLTISATSAAGLLPNKEYKVIITAELDGTSDASYYQVNNEWWLPRDVQIETEVTADANGEFSKYWNAYFASGTYVKFTSVTVEKVPEYVYGTGISLDINAGSGIAVVNELKDSTSDLYIKKITKEATADGFAPFTVSATSAAGLKANTTYLVSIKFEMDGTGNAYYAVNNTVFAKKDGTDWVGYATTDENGEFVFSSTNVYWNAGTYVKFVDIKIVESVYGKGVTLGLVIKNDASVKTTNTVYVNEETNLGMMQLNRIETHNGELSISASFAAGLKANTQYTVKISAETDGTSQATYYEAANAWWVPRDNPITITVMTDENGEFSQTWNNVYFASGTYIRFTSVTVTEVEVSE